MKNPTMEGKGNLLLQEWNQPPSPKIKFLENMTSKHIRKYLCKIFFFIMERGSKEPIERLFLEPIEGLTHRGFYPPPPPQESMKSLNGVPKERTVFKFRNLTKV